MSRRFCKRRGAAANGVRRFRRAFFKPSGSVAVALAGVALLCALPAGGARPIRRGIPRPLAGHPGNVFLQGEDIAVDLPAGASGAWQVVDYGGHVVKEGINSSQHLDLGALPVGYYEVRGKAMDSAPGERITIGVLHPLKAATPMDSPICLDVAMSWFFPVQRMPAAADLCALAGVNWVRDRLSWPEMEPHRGELAGTNRYDAAARIQSAAGLQVLQVNHLCPSWAGPKPNQFPRDLRDLYRFYRALAVRWRGEVRAFEPWNEADIPMFGGQIGSQIATLQKAAYLALKAGNPDLIVCQNVFAEHRRTILRNYFANRPWPYEDTFNLHHYAALDQYPKIYSDFREVSGGRPLWVTEFSMPVKWSGSPKLKEPDAASLRLQAERVAQCYAASIFQGSAASFYFLLPHYSEDHVQFGLLHPDLSPRPAYVALAAVGRLLAGARALGRLKTSSTNVEGYLFEAEPDGISRAVLVAWTRKGNASISLPAEPIQTYDLLGRPQEPVGKQLKLQPAPMFALFSQRTARQFQIVPPPRPARWRPGSPSPLVLQALWPRDKVDRKKSAYELSTTKANNLPLYLYNFRQSPARGFLDIHAPRDWSVQALAASNNPPSADSEQISAENGLKELRGITSVPGEKKRILLRINCRAGKASPSIEKLIVTGHFGPAGNPILSLRLEARPVRANQGQNKTVRK